MKRVCECVCVSVNVCVCVSGEGLYRCVCMNYPQVLGFPGLHSLVSTHGPP